MSNPDDPRAWLKAELAALYALRNALRTARRFVTTTAAPTTTKQENTK